jgi:hypothetical protein
MVVTFSESENTPPEQKRQVTKTHQAVTAAPPFYARLSQSTPPLTRDGEASTQILNQQPATRKTGT